MAAATARTAPQIYVYPPSAVSSAVGSAVTSAATRAAATLHKVFAAAQRGTVRDTFFQRWQPQEPADDGGSSGFGGLLSTVSSFSSLSRTIWQRVARGVITALTLEQQGLDVHFPGGVQLWRGCVRSATVTASRLVFREVTVSKARFELQGLQLLLPWRRPRSAGLRAPVLLRGKVEMTLDDVMASPLVQRALCRMIERALQKRFARLTRVRFVAAALGGNGVLRARVPRLEGVWIEPDGRVGLSAAVAWCAQGVGGGCDAFAYPVSLRSHLDVRGGGHELAFRDAELLLWSSGGGPAGGVGPARGGAGGGAPPLEIWFPLKLISRTARAGYFIGSSAALEYVKPNASRDRLEASIVAEVKPAGDGSLGGFEMNLGRDDARITVRRPHDRHRPSGQEQMKKRARLSAVRLTFFDLLD